MNLEPLDLLLAEDNEDDIVLIRETMHERKMINIMHVVRDGEEVMAYLRRQGKYADVKRPGLVLMDINMPKKNGLEALEEIKRDPELRMLPVVMLTVSDREEDIVRAYSAGACSYVRKPVIFADFQRVVDQFSLYWALVSKVPDMRQTGNR